MGILWNRSSSLEWDNNGVLAEGALAYFYEAGTTTPKPVYSDGGESVAHEFPIEADGARWPAVFIPFGSFKVIIKTSAGTTLFSADNVQNAAPNDTEVTVDADALLTTGEIFMRLTNGTRSGAVRLNGRTIGDASSGATERANDDCADLFDHVWNTCANAQAAIYDSGGSASTRGATAAADFAAHKRLALPDWRGCNPLGFDDMGNSTANLLGFAPIVTGNFITPGSIAGDCTHTLTTAQIPAHSHTAQSSTTGISGSADSHTTGITINSNTTGVTAGANSNTTGITLTNGTSQVQATGASLNLNLSGASGTAVTVGVSDPGHTHTVSVTDGGHTHAITDGGHTHTLSISDGGHTHTTTNTGSGDNHNNVSRSGLVTYYIKL